MKRIFTFTFLVLMLLGYSHAQGYSTGIGMRGGYTYGLTVKHFFTSDRAVEGIIGGGFRSLRIVGLYEIHANAFDVSRLNWYYGIGGHLAYYTFRGKYHWEWDAYRWIPTDEGPYNKNAVGFGIDGVLGIEYELADIPITVGIDIKPSFEYNTLGYFPFMYWDGAILIRYIF